jgi:uncharacterized protein
LLARRTSEILAEKKHRPWPLPERPWVMGQTWEHLLFAHWRVTGDQLRRVVPARFPLDSFDGSAWIGVTPFVVRGARPRLTPPVPVISRFPELNVRTYVTVGGRPGIYFLSLDAASRLAVFAARRTFRLPYFRSLMRMRRRAGVVTYSSERISTDGEPASFEGSYGPRGEPFVAAIGSLEYFLAERYCLYTLDEEQRVYRTDIHHPPWPLQDAWADIRVNTMADPLGVRLGEGPLLHFAGRQDVLIWQREAVATD